MEQTAETARQLEALIGREGVSADYVRLRIGVLWAQAAALAALGDTPRVPLRPPLRPDAAGFDVAVARRLWQEIAAYAPPVAPAAIGPALLEQWMRAAAFGPDEDFLAALAERLQVPAELALWLGRVLAAPFVTHAARRISAEDAAAAESDGSCPLCGSPPALATLRGEDGRRILHCSLCGHAWPLACRGCPMRGCRGQGTGQVRVPLLCSRNHLLKRMLALPGIEKRNPYCGGCRYVKSLLFDSISN